MLQIYGVPSNFIHCVTQCLTESLRYQIFSAIRLCLLLKHGRLDLTIFGVKRIHGMFDVHLVYFVEEIFDALIVSIVVDHNEANLAGCYKG